MKQEWFNPSNGRRYKVEVYEDLLGDCVLMRRWEGCYKPGNQKMAVLSNYDAAMKEVQTIETKRRLNGYVRVL